MTTKDEALRMALKKAFDLGKRYWSWADSEYSSHWKKADVAKEQFDQLIDDTIREVLAQPEHEPVAWLCRRKTGGSLFAYTKEQLHELGYGNISVPPFDKIAPLYTTPPHRKPLIREEVEAFKKWFDAWWLGDQENGQVVPTQGHELFANYISEYTLAFGAWMAAKETAHGIKE